MAGGQVDGVLGTQLGQLQISGTGYSASHQPATQYHIPPSQYPAAGGWALPHTAPSMMQHGQVRHSPLHTVSILTQGQDPGVGLLVWLGQSLHRLLSNAQDPGSDGHMGAEMKPHHIQVITSGNEQQHSSHTDDSTHPPPKQPVHIYYSQLS